MNRLGSACWTVCTCYARKNLRFVRPRPPSCCQADVTGLPCQNPGSVGSAGFQQFPPHNPQSPLFFHSSPRVTCTDSTWSRIRQRPTQLPHTASVICSQPIHHKWPHWGEVRGKLGFDCGRFYCRAAPTHLATETLSLARRVQPPIARKEIVPPPCKNLAHMERIRLPKQIYLASGGPVVVAIVDRGVVIRTAGNGGGRGCRPG